MRKNRRTDEKLSLRLGTLFPTQGVAQSLTRSFTTRFSQRGPDQTALAYIGLLEGDGVSLSSAQKTAIDTFYVTGKNEGWYSSLKRFYLPIWGAAAPNARCLVSGTSGTFEGSFTYGSGFTHATVASNLNRFNTNYKLLDDDLTTDDGCLMAIAYQSTPLVDHPRAIVGGNHTIIGAGSTTAKSIRINSGSSSILPCARWNGVDAVGLATYGSHGVLLANRESGETTLHRRTSTGIHERSTTGTVGGGGSYQNYPITGFGSAASTTGATTQSTLSKSGAFGISKGLDATDRSAYTDAVKTLWESCSGLTLVLS